MTRICVLLLLLFAPIFAVTQDAPANTTERKVVRQVVPIYPELARKMNISGVVKLLATVDAGGSVKSVTAVGGNPVLIKAAQDAAMNWKYAPSSAETRQLIELRFSSR
jgi:protein TonB